jgi:60 kDa SS-A/Ro ribonucleoprotein
MANKCLFKSAPGKNTPNTVNEAGGTAYQLGDESALATYACTGVLYNTYYATAEQQLETVKELYRNVNPEFIAKAAVYARQQGFMKDMPAVLLSFLLTKDAVLFERIFPKICDNAKMIRNFVQVVRSNLMGRKSFGTVARRCIRNWFNGWTNADALFNSSVGNNPSLGNVIRLVHPKPRDEQFSTLFAYLCGFPHDKEKLPPLVQAYEKAKTTEGYFEVPDVNFQYLTTLKLSSAQWRQIARTASWQTTRMNLNTFQRHGVFDASEMIDFVANKLTYPKEIAESKVMPYQLLMAYLYATDIDDKLKSAINTAMEISVDNVPEIAGNTVVCVDTSGSMECPVTATGQSKARYCDVAGLFASAILRKNSNTTIIKFDTDAWLVNLNPSDSVIANTRIIGQALGGTNVEAALNLIIAKKIPVDTVIIISDNESWLHERVMTKWKQIEQQNKGKETKCICINIQPVSSSVLQERKNIVNIAGFSDAVFQVVAKIAERGADNAFVKAIEDVEI